jgi:uncharacterized protein YndB with AHSA1/START domain
MTPETLEISANRWLHAPISLVFRAFTEPHLLERWFCPSPDVALQVERCNPQVGGDYRFVFYFPGGRAVPVVGEYRIVEPPHRLVFTWTWEAPDPWAGVVTLVSVNLTECDGGTSVEVRHAQMEAGEMTDMHQSGWTATLARLDETLHRLAALRKDRAEQENAMKGASHDSE